MSSRRISHLDGGSKFSGSPPSTEVTEIACSPSVIPLLAASSANGSANSSANSSANGFAPGSICEGVPLGVAIAISLRQSTPRAVRPGPVVVTLLGSILAATTTNERGFCKVAKWLQTGFKMASKWLQTWLPGRLFGAPFDVELVSTVYLNYIEFVDIVETVDIISSISSRGQGYLVVAR